MIDGAIVYEDTDPLFGPVPCFLCGRSPSVNFLAWGNYSWTHLCPNHPLLGGAIRHEWFGVHGLPSRPDAIQDWNRTNAHWAGVWERLHRN